MKKLLVSAPFGTPFGGATYPVTMGMFGRRRSSSTWEPDEPVAGRRASLSKWRPRRAEGAENVPEDDVADATARARGTPRHDEPSRLRAARAIVGARVFAP